MLPKRFCSSLPQQHSQQQPQQPQSQPQQSQQPQQEPRWKYEQQAPLPQVPVTPEKAAQLEKARSAARLIYFTRNLSKNKTGNCLYFFLFYFYLFILSFS